MKIAGTQGGAFYLAGVVDRDGTPTLVTKQKILDRAIMPLTTGVETQNFRPPAEKELIFSAYGYQRTEVMGLKLDTGEVVNYSQAPDQDDEPEGIFPDGRHTLVECDAHNPKGSQYIDIYKLALDGSGTYERITYFGEYPGYKASNPVVSDDGRFLAFQYAKIGDRAGIGRGIFVLDLQLRERMKK